MRLVERLVVQVDRVVGGSGKHQTLWSLITVGVKNGSLGLARVVVVVVVYSRNRIRVLKLAQSNNFMVRHVARCSFWDKVYFRRFGKSLARVLYQGLGVLAPRSVFSTCCFNTVIHAKKAKRGVGRGESAGKSTLGWSH